VNKKTGVGRSFYCILRSFGLLLIGLLLASGLHPLFEKEDVAPPKRPIAEIPPEMEAEWHKQRNTMLKFEGSSYDHKY